MHLSAHKWAEDAIRLTGYCKSTMSLSRKRRRKQARRRHHEARPASVDDLRDGGAAQFSPEHLFELRRRLDESRGSTPDETDAGVRDGDEATITVPFASNLREARRVQRLAYTRRQAAEALGVSVSTIDRRVVPLVETVKTPWGQRLIPADELRRLLRNHREPAPGSPAHRPAGRPATLPQSVVERIPSSTRAASASPRSPADSPTKPSRQRTAAAAGGHQPCERFSSVRVPLTSTRLPELPWGDAPAAAGRLTPAPIRRVLELEPAISSLLHCDDLYCRRVAIGGRRDRIRNP